MSHQGLGLLADPLGLFLDRADATFDAAAASEAAAAMSTAKTAAKLDPTAPQVTSNLTTPLALAVLRACTVEILIMTIKSRRFNCVTNRV